MSDRKLGYIIIALILCAGLGAAAYIVRLIHTPLEVRTLRFEQVGSLAVEDGVRLNGTLVGSVREFAHDENNMVLVRVHSRKPIPIREGSRVAVKVKGVMGERFIEIEIGDQNKPLIPSCQIVDGVFEMGPSEAIVYIDLLEDKLIELKNIMILLSKGSQTQRSFIDGFTDVVTVLDSLVWTITDGLVNIETGLAAGLDSAAALATKTIEFTAGVAAKAPQLIADVDAIMAKIDNLIPKVETFMQQADAITERVGSNKYLWGDELDKLRKHLAAFKELTDEIRSEKLSIPIRLRFF